MRALTQMKYHIIKILYKTSNEIFKKYSFYPKVKNAFASLDFGNSISGVHGACAVCGFLTFKQKVPNASLNYFLTSFGKGIITLGCVQLNKSIPKLIQQVWRQSYRSFPILTPFTKSFLKVKF